MKNLIIKSFSLISIIILISVNTRAAEVLSATYINDKKSVSIKVERWGGCISVHEYELEYKDCSATIPAQCEAKLVDLTKAKDECDYIINETIIVPIKSKYVDNSSYKNALFTIKGDYHSSVTFKLP